MIIMIMEFLLFLLGFGLAIYSGVMVNEKKYGIAVVTGILSIYILMQSVTITIVDALWNIAQIYLS